MGKTLKGKISRSEWPSILERHRAGEPLASIARSYGCTAPAVRYIVTRGLSGDEQGSTPVPAAGETVRPSAPPLRRRSHASATDDARDPELSVVGNRQRREAAPRIVLDAALRERVNSAIAFFLTAFDGVIIEGTEESLGNLLTATDQLLRAGARTRIEVEKLLAREPDQERRAVLETVPAVGDRPKLIG
jgi:hypothetical protein